MTILKFLNRNINHHLSLGSIERKLRCDLIARKMPKDPVAARAMKMQRLAKAAKFKDKTFGPSSRLTFHVVGNGGPGNPSCLYLVTDHHRYLFNCGEGVQRLCNEHGMKLPKLEQVFITQPVWKNIGGLPGLCLTLQSNGVPSINIHSPTDIIKLFDMTRLFSITNDLLVLQNTVEDAEFSDPTMKVKYVPLIKPNSKIKPENYCKKMKITSECRNIVLSYICSLQPKPGALNIKKCMELKVPKGPLLGDLKNGIDITLADGTVVKSADVTDPPEPEDKFLIIDSPSEDYINSLLTNRDVLRHTISDALKQDIPQCIFHFSPPEVLRNEAYMKWIFEMPSSIKHFLVNRDNPVLAFRGAAELQAKLETLDPDLFPSLVTSSQCDNHILSQLEPCPTLKKFEVRLRYSDPEKDEDFNFDSEKWRSVALAVEDFPEAVEQYQEKISEMKFNKNNVYPIVTFFGTGSSIPSQYRNTSCIHVAVSENQSLIMDCAEQSYGQMLRMFGTEKIEQELAKVNCIFISHIHADHHLGLITILKERHKTTYAPVILIGPKSIDDWLQNYSDAYENVSYMYNFYESFVFLKNSAKFLDTLDLEALRTFKVKHCRDAYGITITTKGNINGIGENPFKIVYSGDAMPSPQLVHAGTGCDLLIHEATMEDDLAEEAIIKKHSTTSQAIEMGIRCKARNVILTHFSQRYAKIPMISEELLKQSGNVSVAFDNMVIHRYDYDKLPFLYTPLRVLFNEYVVRNDEKLKRLGYRENYLQEPEVQTSASVETSSTN